MAQTRKKRKIRRLELKCVNYALQHGKHKAQLKYAKTHPELKISWKRISDLIAKLGQQSKYNAEKDKFIPVPQVIQQKVATFAHANGVESAQVHFTKTNPEYLFPHNVVQRWTKATHPNSKFNSTFVKHLNDAIKARGSTLKISDMPFVSRDVAFDYNKDKQNLVEQITGRNVLEEWIHVVNKRLADLQSLNCRMCGKAFKSRKEVEAHICIAQTLPKRSSRTAVIAAPRPTSRTSDSDSVESDLFSCDSCDYKTVSSTQYNKHLKTHKTPALAASGRRQSKLGLLTCNFCSYQSISEEELHEHYQKVHLSKATQGNDEQIECEDCKESFPNYYSILKHKCSAKKETIIFTPVPRPTYSVIELATSIEPVSYICPRCVTEFESIEQLRSHYNLNCESMKLPKDTPVDSVTAPQPENNAMTA